MKKSITAAVAVAILTATGIAWAVTSNDVAASHAACAIVDSCCGLCE